MLSRNIEIDDIDLQIKHTSFTVEQNTGKFCFVTDDEDPESGIKKSDFHIYCLDKEKNKLKEIGKQLKKLTTECIFSPNG